MTTYSELGNVKIVSDEIARNPSNEWNVHTVVFTMPRGRKQKIATRQIHDDGTVFDFSVIG